jgi:hypothetical protein
VPVVCVGVDPSVVYLICATPDPPALVAAIVSETPGLYQALPEQGEPAQLIVLTGAAMSTWISAELTGSALNKGPRCAR